MSPQYARRWSLIAALVSDHEFLWIIIDTTVTSEWFVKYMCILKFWLEFRKINVTNQAIVTLDNVRVRLSELSTNRMSNIGFNITLLPAYPPELAPIEILFKQAKLKMKVSYSDAKLDFNKASGHSWINDTLNNLITRGLNKIRIIFISNTKRCKIDLDEMCQISSRSKLM